MRTYTLISLLLACLFFGCTTDDGQTDITDDNPNIEADYSILLTANNTVSNTLLKANGESISVDPATSPFESFPAPDLSCKADLNFVYYKVYADCSAEIALFNFLNYSKETFAVFEDLDACNLTTRDVIETEGNFYLAYEMPGLGPKGLDYFIRTIDFSEPEAVISDLEIMKQPLQFVATTDRLFILVQDVNTEEYALLVMDLITGTIIHDMNLDIGVQRIFKNTAGKILVSYETLHLLVNPNSLGIEETIRYTEGFEPKFGYTTSGIFDETGNLYYKVPTDPSDSDYQNIPGVYDFSSNTAILYFYENFLTETEREIEFEIGDTSLVSYDAKNNLILIGYQKSSDSNKGGLLRIRPVPEPAFIDNINLDGVPLQLFTP
jgi:hypothetical protein